MQSINVEISTPYVAVKGLPLLLQSAYMKCIDIVLNETTSFSVDFNAAFFWRSYACDTFRREEIIDSALNMQRLEYLRSIVILY